MFLKESKLGRRLALSGFALASALIVSAPAHAFVRSGQANAFGVYVNLDVPGTPASVEPTPFARGSSPPAFTTENTAPSVVTSSAGNFELSTGPIAAGASSSVDGTMGPKSAIGKVLAKQIRMVVNSDEFYRFELQADTLGSTAKVSGDSGVFTPYTSFQTVNAVGRIGDEVIFFWPNARANTVVWDDGHIRIVQNEVVSVQNRGQITVYANAVHAWFRDMPTREGPINGEIVIGHSEGSLVSK